MMISDIENEAPVEAPLENEPEVPEGDDGEVREGTSVPPIHEDDLTDAPDNPEEGPEDEEG